MPEQNSIQVPVINPFQNIGIAFSGGGFRAAAFALGTLSYLNKLKFLGHGLNEHITFSSSASGGTITNLLYTAGIHNGDRFLKIYHDTISVLNGEDILQLVLMIINNDEEWGQPGQEKRQNLINAFAKAYDRLLFNYQTMDVYANKKFIKQYEVCLNATEFYRGLSFRFQTDGTKNRFQVIGNNYLKFDVKKLDTFKKIKLADILAASSCFPGGFEPIVYPEDFSYMGLDSKELREAVIYENYQEVEHHLDFEPDEQSRKSLDDPKQKGYLNSFGLMDGGMTDNQGLSSLMLADDKRRARKNPNPFDLMIVTDVASYFMDNYEVPATKPANGWRKQNIDHYIRLFRSIALKLHFIPWISLAAIIGLIAWWFFARTLFVTFICSFAGGIAVLIGIASFWLNTSETTKGAIDSASAFNLASWFKETLPTIRNFSDRIISKLADYLRLTKLRIMEQMLKARLNSVLMMVSDINLKQVRRLIYQQFYDNPKWENRRVPNFIYELSEHNTKTRSKRIQSTSRLKWTASPNDKKLLLEGLENIYPVAEEARLMGTTLWFDDEDKDKLRTIIATGQFTICMNLLEYLLSLRRKQVPFSKQVWAEIETVQNQLEADIGRFKDTPFFMYDEYIEDGKKADVLRN